MNNTEPDSNSTSTPYTENVPVSSLPTTPMSPASPLPPSYSPGVPDPEFTIMVVVGLLLVLAGLAAFLAVCRPSEQDGGSEASCGPGGSSARGGGRSSEPQLKVWKRLGSYRRSYNISFRRPPHRRPYERESAQVCRPPARQTPQPDSRMEPPLTTPCLFDYVTEI